MSMGNSSTIQEYILEFNNEELVCSSFFLKQVFSSQNNLKMLVNFDNLILKYMPELDDIKIKVSLSNEEYAKYKFNPKALSYDIYGTTELWFLILEANDLHSSTEFNSQTIYLFRSNIIDKLIRILNLETETKNYNEEEISKDLI
jgi:hypothetical protein